MVDWMLGDLRFQFFQSGHLAMLQVEEVVDNYKSCREDYK